MPLNAGEFCSPPEAWAAPGIRVWESEIRDCTADGIFPQRRSPVAARTSLATKLRGRLGGQLASDQSLSVRRKPKGRDFPRVRHGLQMTSYRTMSCAFSPSPTRSSSRSPRPSQGGRKSTWHSWRPTEAGRPHGADRAQPGWQTLDMSGDLVAAHNVWVGETNAYEAQRLPTSDALARWLVMIGAFVLAIQIPVRPRRRRDGPTTRNRH